MELLADFLYGSYCGCQDGAPPAVYTSFVLASVSFVAGLILRISKKHLSNTFLASAGIFLIVAWTGIESLSLRGSLTIPFWFPSAVTITVGMFLIRHAPTRKLWALVLIPAAFTTLSHLHPKTNPFIFSKYRAGCDKSEEAKKILVHLRQSQLLYKRHHGRFTANLENIHLPKLKNQLYSYGFISDHGESVSTKSFIKLANVDICKRKRIKMDRNDALRSLKNACPDCLASESEFMAVAIGKTSCLPGAKLDAWVIDHEGKLLQIK